MKQTVREAIAFLSRLPAYYTVDTIVVHVEPQPKDPQQLDLFKPIGDCSGSYTYNGSGCAYHPSRRY